MARTYTPSLPIWCAGCGHFGVLNALRSAVRDLRIPLHEVALLAGIGCSGTIQNYLGTYGYHALHGRVVPTAIGVALADPRLTVVAAGGDGDGYAIGAGHLIHAFRRNVSLTYVCMNNETYGLTKGQSSPSGFLAGDEGSFDGPLAGLAIRGSTFIARGYTGRPEQLARLMRAALEHSRERRGFAFLEVISPCVTYADTYPDWEHTLYDVDADAAYSSGDRALAFSTALRLAEDRRLPIGLLYRAAEHAADASAPAVPASSGAPTPDLVARYEELLGRYAVRRSSGAGGAR